MSYEPNQVLDALLNTELEVTKDVDMPRFGVPFTLRAITMKEYNRLQKQATNLSGSKGNTIKTVDEEQFAALLITTACVTPNWSDPALLKKFDAQTGADVVSKRLLAGELMTLSNEIMDVSGFDMDALTGKAKN